MMTASQRLLKTLEFHNMTEDGGACLETFFPWTLTVDRWIKEGLPQQFGLQSLYPAPAERFRRYFNTMMTQPVNDYEQYLGLESVVRMSFRIPFKCFDKKVLQENEEYCLCLDEDGWQRRYYKTRELVQDIKPIVQSAEDWECLKKRVQQELDDYCTEENLRQVYGVYAQGNKDGDFSVRFRISGFFWTSRELLGVEEQLIAFYEEPELLHEINIFILNTYLQYLDRIFDVIKPEVILLEEDLSGSNGPMISPAMFDEFVGAYYKKLFPMLKQKGVKNIFVDTDGDFQALIPNFIAAGVDGFLPMDVNAGMDIVEVRKKYPALKFIGAYNKLAITQGKAAIDKEFERIMPVIRQGGYVPGADHQVSPEASLENYRYYLERLHQAMQQCGADIQ